jgi:hypothetical protein
MMRRLLGLLTALIVGITGGALAAVSPALAAASDCNAYPGTICLFAGPNYGLPIWRQYPSQINGCRNLTGFDNVATIIWNNTSGSVQLNVFQYPNCSGATFNVNSTYLYNLSGDWWNDKASSVRVTLA